MRTIKDRLLSKRFISPSGCWEWMGLCQRYGIIRINRSNKKVHRISWELFVGKIPDGMFVCHHCDNAKCFNPEHLFLGTQTDNMQDAANKNRLKIPFCPKNKKAKGDKNGMRTHPKILAGEKNGRSKLTDKQRLEIARRRSLGELRQDLAKEFGVHESQIRRIVSSLGVGKIYPKEWTKKQRGKMSSRSMPVMRRH